MERDREGLIQLFRHTVSNNQEALVSLLQELCDIESGSEMIEGVEQVASRIVQELEALGLSVTRRPAEGFADHLVATTGLADKQIVLGGHLDTTYTDYTDLPKFHVDGEHAIGPGTGDMRGGVLVFLAALRCLKEAGLLDTLPITVILNTDEERGAVTSRALWQRQAQNCLAALFSECAGPDGEIVVSRRAKLSYRLDVKGVGKHAGGKELDKISALTELSHKIIATEALNGEFAGATFNVGRAFGGIASNTVPENATALIDIRYPGAAQEAPIRDAMEALTSKVQVEGASGTLLETSFRPAWERSNVNGALSRMAQRVARELGQTVREESRGGTADSNWFGASGVPCLDGLGPIGFDDHTPKEHIILSTLFERSLLTATLIMTIAREKERLSGKSS